MRCRVGDLAVVIRAHHPENLGRLVKVLRLCANHSETWVIETLGSRFVADVGGNLWTGEHALALDTSLRPLRDDEGTDETLRNLELTQ